MCQTLTVDKVYCEIMLVSVYADFVLEQVGRQLRVVLSLADIVAFAICGCT